MTIKILSSILCRVLRYRPTNTKCLLNRLIGHELPETFLELKHMLDTAKYLTEFILDKKNK